MKTSKELHFNRKQYELITKQGALAWNQWYLSQPYCYHKTYHSFHTLEEFKKAEPYLEDISLENGDFSGMDLKGIKFGGAYLAGANFKNCDLTGAEFLGGQLAKINFQNANLTKARFECCILDYADFRGANLEDTKMVSCFIGGADFRGINLESFDVATDPILTPSSFIKTLGGEAVPPIFE